MRNKTQYVHHPIPSKINPRLEIPVKNLKTLLMFLHIYGVSASQQLLSRHRWMLCIWDINNSSRHDEPSKLITIRFQDAPIKQMNLSGRDWFKRSPLHIVVKMPLRCNRTRARLRIGRRDFSLSQSSDRHRQPDPVNSLKSFFF